MRATVMMGGWWAGKVLVAAVLVSGMGTGVGQRARAVTTLAPLPVGLTLPVRLGRTLRAGAVKPGTEIALRTTQRVPVRGDLYLNAGAVVRGTVMASVEADRKTGAGATLALRFTRLEYGHEAVQLTTKAVAIANFTDVDATAYPATGGPDRGNNSPASWTTVQIGGDEVYRSGWVGDVCDSTMHTVGRADFYGVYGLAQGQDVPKALGVFSSTAKGLYGMEEAITLQSAGGVITLTRPGGKLLLRNGDNLLLEVVPQP